jgi:hypothetical protein
MQWVGPPVGTQDVMNGPTRFKSVMILVFILDWMDPSSACAQYMDGPM